MLCIFSIGGHPAFVCGDNAIGAQLRFGTDNDKVAYKLLSEDGLLMPEEHYLTLVNNNVTITKEFFDKDALIVENSGIKKVSLSKDCEPVVEVMFNAPVFGLWSAAGKGVPFVCIEPWYGRTDAIDSDGSLDARRMGATSWQEVKHLQGDIDVSFYNVYLMIPGSKERSNPHELAK